MRPAKPLTELLRFVALMSRVIASCGNLNVAVWLAKISDFRFDTNALSISETAPFRQPQVMP